MSISPKATLGSRYSAEIESCAFPPIPSNLKSGKSSLACCYLLALVAFTIYLKTSLYLSIGIPDLFKSIKSWSIICYCDFGGRG